MNILRYYWRHLYIDTPLFILLIILCSFGFIMLYSASAGQVAIVVKQGVNFAIAILAMLVVAQIPPFRLKHYATWLVLIGICLLILVLFTGVSIKGATRWLDLGITNLQPSELMKIIIPISVAAILSKEVLPPPLKSIISSILIILVAVFLIYKQPDLGTALLISAAGLYIIFFAGFSIRIFKNPWVNISTLATLIISFLSFAWYFLLENYQKQRILTFLDPQIDALGSGYHITQSKIAIGSGGLFGKGLLQGSQAQLDFLPEHHTDFIFAVIAEELGFSGIVFLFGLYSLILYRCFTIAVKSEDNFSRLLAAGLSAIFFTYIFINIGMVSGLLPVVGVPLPLISYGGSSYITLMMSFGILMSIHRHKSSQLKH